MTSIYKFHDFLTKKTLLAEPVKKSAISGNVFLFEV